MDFKVVIMLVIYLPTFLLIGYYGASLLEKADKKSLGLEIVGYLCTVGFTPLYLIGCLYILELYTAIYYVTIFIVGLFYVYIFTK